MKKISTRTIARAAILLALVIAVQLIGRFIPGPASSFIVGPLVNTCLLVAAVASGIWGGVLISIIAPFSSLLFNHAPVSALLLPFAPFIAIGNILFVLSFYMLRKKSDIIAVSVSSLVKFLFLWGAVTLFFTIFSFSGINSTLIETVKFLFSWPQLVTAVLGGIIAIIVIKALGKTIEQE